MAQRSFFWKHGKPLAKAAMITVFVLIVETFQLTGIPLQFRLSGNLALKLLSIALGTRFGWWDIVAYLAGISGVYLVDCFYRRRSVNTPYTSVFHEASQGTREHTLRCSGKPAQRI
jgi:hypothetical protein